MMIIENKGGNMKPIISLCIALAFGVFLGGWGAFNLLHGYDALTLQKLLDERLEMVEVQQQKILGLRTDLRSCYALVKEKDPHAKVVPRLK